MRFAPTVAIVLAAAAASFALASPAAADETRAAAGPGYYVMPVQTVYGRPNKPLVQIVLKTPTAAEAAGAAHESLRASLMAQSTPAGLK
jgi:hypothetical protein